jgi:hypothetical protein
MFSKKLFNVIKSKIPKISSTELIALRSGNTSLDRTILQGYLKFPQKKKLNNKFSENKLNDRQYKIKYIKHLYNYYNIKNVFKI